MQLKTIIIEDEEKTVLVIKDLVHKFNRELELCGSAGHIQPAVKLIEETAPQLVLMDVRLGDGMGFDVLRQLPLRNFEVIFITAFDNYALDAIQFAAIDYLMKPVGIPEFNNAILRAVLRLREKIRHNRLETLLYNISQKDSANRKLAIASSTGYDFIDLANIVWCHSDGSYTCFYLADKSRIISSKNIGHYEEILSSANFFRINNSAMIHIQFLKSYSRNKGAVTMSDGTELPISTRRKADFLEALKHSPNLKGIV